MTELAFWTLLALAALNFLGLLWLLFRPAPDSGKRELLSALGTLGAGHERLERELRSEGKSNAQETRSEVTQRLSQFQQTLLAQSGEVARTQNERIESFRAQLAGMQQQVTQTLQDTTQVLLQQAQSSSEALTKAMAQAGESQITGLTQAREAQTVGLALASEAQTQRLSQFQQALLAQSGEVARTQNEQIDAFREQLAAMQQQVAQTLQVTTQVLTQQAQSSIQALIKALAQASEAQIAGLTQAREAQTAGLALVSEAQTAGSTKASESQAAALMQSREAQDMALKRFADGLNDQLRQMTEGNERRLVEVRQSVEQKLTALQDGNEKKLDQMRATVDEKLHATLEARLGESFKQVADRLEQVHKGLGEMQTLAAGVGDLKHLLSNVKTRGMFGEAQLGALLEQVFAPDQYAAQVVTRPGSKNPVDFAIKLPGKAEDGTPLWLPIDAKFPNEDYARLLDAQGRADAVAAELAGKALEVRIRLEAKSIADKYVEPPYTTDFAILFLPTEGLYAEVLRRPGLMEGLQRDHRVTLAGPTTLMAMLNALHMGFRTLALEKRSSEVWQVLAAVKTEFGKFGDVLAKVKTQAQTVLNTLDQAQTRTNVMTRALRSVEALPEPQAAGLLPGLDGASTGVSGHVNGNAGESDEGV